MFINITTARNHMKTSTSRSNTLTPRVATPPSPQVDMHVLFPDLYQPKEQVTTMMAGRVVPPTSMIKNNRQIYIASQSVGLYSMHFLSKTPTVAVGFGNGKFNVHDLNTTKRCHTAEVTQQNITFSFC